MICVADTSPLNYLVLIGAIEILPRLFEAVFIPPAVLMELERLRAPEIVRAWAQSPPKWLEIRRPLRVVEILGLHRGETEAIALAEELKANQILIDERDAARVAGQRGLEVVGTLAVLGEAAARGWLDLPLAIQKLRSTNFRMPEDRVRDLLQLDSERRARRERGHH